MYYMTFSYSGGSNPGPRVVVSEDRAFSKYPDKIKGIDKEVEDFREYNRSKVTNLKEYELINIAEYFEDVDEPSEVVTQLVKQNKIIEHDDDVYVIGEVIADRKDVTVIIKDGTLKITANENAKEISSFILTKGVWTSNPTVICGDEKYDNCTHNFILNELYNFLKVLNSAGYFS